MIPDRTVDEVRERADLVEVVGEVVELRKSGREWKGKCPFHDDRTPSFYVVPDKGFYKCFGCGESGDVFSFVMKRSGMDFNDAIKHLASRFGVEVVEVGGDDRAEDPHRPLYEANAFARDWFRSRLEDPKEGAAARAYLEGRGIDAGTAERFGLGFAPEGWQGLREHASRHGFTDEVLLEAGLITRSERAPEPYDRFRNRIIFPIETASGKVVAFGGRVLGRSGDGVPKYLNSSESPVYQKGEILYALGWNRNSIRREEVALVVEGYMDVVALGAGGVDNAVATLGTAMTPEHAVLLRRYTRRVLLLFDSDEAGLRATFRAGDVLLAAGIHPSVVTFPPGEDPDSVILEEGEAALRGYLAGAVDLLDRKIQLLDEKGYFTSIDRTRRALDKLLPTVRVVHDPALRDLYVAKVAERTGVRRETVEEEVARVSLIDGRRSDRAASAPGVPRAPNGGRGGYGERGFDRATKSRLPPGLGPERQLLMVLLHSREWIDRAAEHVGPDDFIEPVYREIFERLLDDPELVAGSDGLPPEVMRRLEELQGDPEELEHTGKVFDASIAVLRDRASQRRQQELASALRSATSPEQEREVLEELNQLRRDRRGRWNVIRGDRPTGSTHKPERMDQ